MVLVVKNPPAIAETQETWVQSLDQEDSLREEMATCSDILAREEAGRLESMGSQRVRHD